MPLPSAKRPKPPTVYTPEQAEAVLAQMHNNPVSIYTPSQTIVEIGYFSSIKFKAPFTTTYRWGDVRFKDQEAQPDNPGIRDVTESTYGRTIPLSIGKRRIGGNVIQSTKLVPRLVGTHTYDITYQIPIYEDIVDHGIQVKPCSPPENTFCQPWFDSGNPEGRPDPENPPDDCGGDDPCDPQPRSAAGPATTYMFSQCVDNVICYQRVFTGGTTYNSIAEAEAAIDLLGLEHCYGIYAIDGSCATRVAIYIAGGAATDDCVADGTTLC